MSDHIDISDEAIDAYCQVVSSNYVRGVRLAIVIRSIRAEAKRQERKKYAVIIKQLRKRLKQEQKAVKRLLSAAAIRTRKD